MQPFRVICETCGSRLRVRDPSIVGQIHACPKCESMVHILPPARMMEPDATTSLSSEQTAPSVPALSGIGQMPASTSPSLTDAVSADVVAPNAAPPLANPAPPASSSWFIWITGGAAVLLVSGLVTSALLGGDSNSAAESESIARAAPEASPEPAPLTKAAAPAPHSTTNRKPVLESDATTADPPPLADLPPDATQAPLAADFADELAEQLPDLPGDAAPEPAQQEPPEAQEASIGAPSPDDADALEHPQASDATPQPDTPGVLRFDPLDFDPSQLSLTGGVLPSATEESIAGDRAASDPEPTSESNEADAPAPLPARPAVDQTLWVRLGPIAEPASTAGDEASKLSTRVESLQVAEMRLTQFVEVISQLSGLCVTIDPIAMERAGVAMDATVTINQQDVTLEEALRAGLADNRLEVAERTRGAVTVLAGAEDTRQREHEIGDLASATDGAATASLIKTFVAPEAWKSSGGKATIELMGTKVRVTGPRWLQHEVLIFCERLRAARGLSARSKYPESLLRPSPPQMALRTKLAAKTTFTFLPWSRLDEVFAHWDEQSGLTILVDWAALRDLELGPATPIACAANDRAWVEVLRDTLAPLDLAWWAVNDTTIQITSSEEFEALERVELYPLPEALAEQFTDVRALVDALIAELEQRSADATIEFDAPSQRLIVRGPLAAHRYLAERLQ